MIPKRWTSCVDSVCVLSVCISVYLPVSLSVFVCQCLSASFLAACLSVSVDFSVYVCVCIHVSVLPRLRDKLDKLYVACFILLLLL